MDGVVRPLAFAQAGEASAVFKRGVERERFAALSMRFPNFRLDQRSDAIRQNLHSHDGFDPIRDYRPRWLGEETLEMRWHKYWRVGRFFTT